MKRSVLGILIAVVAITAIAGIVAVSIGRDSGQRAVTTPGDGNAPIASDTPARQDDALPVEPAGENQISIVDFNFNPETLTIKKGTTVTWTNRDDARHDVTPDEETEFFQGSELLSKGETYSFTFNEPGTYSYHCSPHPYMTASVEVVE